MTLGSAESEELMVKLFSKNSNLCDHDTSTSQTDGLCRSNTALCVASRGKMVQLTADSNKAA